MLDRRISAAVRSGKGCVRGNNEDSFYLNGRFMPLQEMDQGAAFSMQSSDDIQLYAVMDGMGGISKGEEASFTAASMADSLVYALKKRGFREAAAAWTETVNTKVVQDVPGGGATLALAAVKEHQLYIAHLGDSRVYRVHAGVLRRVTEDHSEMTRLLRLGLIEPGQIASHPLRHAITRYLGMPGDGIAPEFSEPLPLEPGDRYLLCSDGVTDMLPDVGLHELLTQHATADAAAEAVYNAALIAGGEDNTTVIVLDVEATAAHTSRKRAPKAWKLGFIVALVAALTIAGALLLRMADIPVQGLPVPAAVSPKKPAIETAEAEEHATETLADLASAPTETQNNTATATDAS